MIIVFKFILLIALNCLIIAIKQYKLQIKHSKTRNYYFDFNLNQTDF